jgi:hypothetical protein
MKNSVVIMLDIMEVIVFKNCSLKAPDVDGLPTCVQVFPILLFLCCVLKG